MMAGWCVLPLPRISLQSIGATQLTSDSPALTATLWDVTDRDIDRLTNAVYNRLGLNPTQIMEQIKPRAEHSAPGLLPPSGQGLGISTVEAVNQSRGDCKMTYLTGAAVVHYGIPVYIY